VSNGFGSKFNILRVIQQHKAITIKNVAKLVSQSIPNVTNYVNDMIKAGILCEDNNTAVTTGRRPKLVSLNPSYGYIVGVDLGKVNSASIGIFDFSGHRLGTTFTDINTDNDANLIIDNIIIKIEDHISSLSLDRGRLLAIVIGNPGVVDHKTGMITLSAPSAKWHMLPIKQIFEDHFNVSVKVLNDIDLSSVGEKEYGMGRGYNNFIFVRSDVGLKAGIILNNRLYRGEMGAAGEIGYNVILADTGENGKCRLVTAESLLSMSSILEHITKELTSHPDDLFYSITNGNERNVTINNILRVLGSDSYVTDVIANRGELFGYVLLNVVTTLDISLVIIGGEIIKFHNYFFKGLRAVLAKSLPNPPTVLVSSLGDDVALWGAFSVGLEHIFRQINDAT